MKILVVEDDLTLSAGLCFELDTGGYLTVAAYNCQKARILLKEQVFDLVLLDVNLPDGSGFDLCREIKEQDEDLPVLFLTANDLDEDVINGFELGADDYITKPFNTKVLLKRMEVALRRKRHLEHPDAEEKDRDLWRDEKDGFLMIDFGALTVSAGGEKTAVTPNEYKLLRALTGHAGNVVTRQFLLESLWDSEGNFIDDHTLTVTMNRLRSKIEDLDHSYIQTVRGMGYIWTGGKGGNG